MKRSGATGGYGKLVKKVAKLERKVAKLERDGRIDIRCNKVGTMGNRDIGRYTYI